jgi:hypothetical protein
MSTVKEHFEKSSPAVRAAYDAILKAARALGPVEEEPKKTSIHLANGTAFAGIATRKDALLLTLKSSEKINSPRVHKAEQTSANRWHVEIRIAKPGEVDRELRAWLKAAYDLSQTTRR